MTKNKKRKETKKDSGYRIELVGILLILIAVIGTGQFGLIGKIFSRFAVFLCGSFSGILLVFVFLIGGYIVLKRDLPNFFTSRLVGFYILFIGVLVLSHVSYLTKHSLDAIKVLEETINNFMVASSSLEGIQGGGIIGAGVSVIFLKLFDIEGSFIVCGALFGLGIILLFNVSIIDFFRKIWFYLYNKIKNRPKKEKPIETEKEEEVNVDSRVVVADEVHHVSEEVKNEPVETVTSPNFDNTIIRNIGYTLPPLSILDAPHRSKKDDNTANIKRIIDTLHKVFEDFQINGKVVQYHVGPTVTEYEIEIKAGTKVSRILSINREIALALAAKDIRIQAPIPGKNTIGIEVPNPFTTMVGLREILMMAPKEKDRAKLLVGLGKDIQGGATFMEINKTPHLLVAGATGSGKSVCINGIIASILMRAKPDEVKLLMVDPKKVELSGYNGIPHLLGPVVTDPKKASMALQKIVMEMEHRYDLFSDSGTKNIETYNNYIDKKNEHLPDIEKSSRLPYIVVIVDELADLMVVASKEVEESIMRITQMARAAGIHLIVATQRPSTDVITGIVKANIPSRIAFSVSSSIDSRTILDMMGAEKLLGKGDMLFLPMGENTPTRIQGAYISDDEIARIIDYVCKQQKARYDEKMLNLDATSLNEERKASVDKEEYEEPLYNEIVDFCIKNEKVSASLLQRKYRLGYNRAARIIDLLEERGVVGPQNGSKPREVLIKNNEKDE